MATTPQVEAYSNALIAQGVVPDRMINSGRSRLAFILVQGFQNEHEGRLPSSPDEFRAWAAAPYWQNAGLRRYWPPGSRDVKSDGSSNPPPWDWAPMGWPDGNGGNMEDYQNRTPWPDPGGGSAVVVAPGPGPVVVSPIGGGLLGGGTLPTVGGIKLDSPIVLGAIGLAVLLVLRRR